MQVLIKDIAVIQMGYQFRGKLEPDQTGTYQVIQVKDIAENNDHKLLADNLWRINIDTDVSKYQVFDGNVLFMFKGRRNFATCLQGLNGTNTIASGSFLILRVNHNILTPEYLTWYINQQTTQKTIQGMAKGTGIPFISRAEIETLTIQIPPLAIQNKITEIHDLARHESELLNRLRDKRVELASGICMGLIKNKYQLKG